MINKIIQNYTALDFEEVSISLEEKLKQTKTLLLVGELGLQNLGHKFDVNLVDILATSVLPLLINDSEISDTDYDLYIKVVDILEVDYYAKEDIREKMDELEQICNIFFIQINTIITLLDPYTDGELFINYLEFLVCVSFYDYSKIMHRLNIVNGIENIDIDFEQLDKMFKERTSSSRESNLDVNRKSSPLYFISEKEMLERAQELEIYPELDVFGKIMFDKKTESYLIDVRDETLILSDKISCFKRQYIVVEDYNDDKLINIDYPLNYKNPASIDVFDKTLSPFYLPLMRNERLSFNTNETSLKKLQFETCSTNNIQLDISINSPYLTDFSKTTASITGIKSYEILGFNAYLLDLEIDFSNVPLEDKWLNFHFSQNANDEDKMNYLLEIINHHSEYIPLVMQEYNLFSLINNYDLSNIPMLFQAVKTQNIQSFYNLIKLGANPNCEMSRIKEDGELFSVNLINFITVANSFSMLFLTLFADVDYHKEDLNGQQTMATAFSNFRKKDHDSDAIMILKFFELTKNYK